MAIKIQNELDTNKARKIPEGGLNKTVYNTAKNTEKSGRAWQTVKGDAHTKGENNVQTAVPERQSTGQITKRAETNATTRVEQTDKALKEAYKNNVTNYDGMWMEDEQLQNYETAKANVLDARALNNQARIDKSIVQNTITYDENGGDNINPVEYQTRLDEVNARLDEIASAVKNNPEYTLQASQESLQLNDEKKKLEDGLQAYNGMYNVAQYENAMANGDVETAKEYGDLLSAQQQNFFETRLLSAEQKIHGIYTDIMSAGALLADGGMALVGAGMQNVAQNIYDKGEMSEEDFNAFMDRAKELKDFEASDWEYAKQLREDDAHISQMVATAGSYDGAVMQYIGEAMDSSVDFMARHLLFGPDVALKSMVAQGFIDRYYQLADTKNEDGSPKYTQLQMLSNATLNAMIEYYTEKWPIDAFTQTITGGASQYVVGQALRYAMKATGQQMLAEGAEEFVGAMLEPIANAITLGEPIEYNPGDIFHATIVGGLSGGMSGVGGVGVFTLRTKAQYDALSQDVNTLKDIRAKAVTDNNTTPKDLARIDEAIRIGNLTLAGFNEKSMLSEAVEQPSKDSVEPNATNENINKLAQNALKPNLDEQLARQKAIDTASDSINRIAQNVLYDKGVNMDVNQFTNLDNQTRMDTMKLADNFHNGIKNVDLGFDSSVPVNGYIVSVKDGKPMIVINPESTKMGGTLSTVSAVHELVHSIEGTPEYLEIMRLLDGKKLASKSFDLAQGTYKGVDADPMSEAVAIELSENVINSEDFIEHMAKYNTSTAYKLFYQLQGIKGLFGNSTQEEQIIRRMTKALNSQPEVYFEDGVHYSKTGTFQKQVSSLFDRIRLGDTNESNDTIPMLDTNEPLPKWAQDLGLPRAMFVIGTGTLSDTQYDKDDPSTYNFRSSRWHHDGKFPIPRGVVEHLDVLVKHPLAVFNGSIKNTYMLVLNATDSKGYNIVATFSPAGARNKDGKVMTLNYYDFDLIKHTKEPTNFETSLYGKNNVPEIGKFLNQKNPDGTEKFKLLWAPNGQNKNQVISEARTLQSRSSHHSLISPSIAQEIRKSRQLRLIEDSKLDFEDRMPVQNVSDILTYEEAVADDDALKEGVSADFTAFDVENALKTGYITLYSDQPIQNGVFVTPSRLAIDGDEVYSMRAKLTDVAWIDSLEGQYAKVGALDDINGIRFPLYDRPRGRVSANDVRDYINAYKSKDTQKAQEVLDKVARENGYNIKAYHGTNSKFTVFDPKLLGSKNFMADSARMGFFASASRATAESYTGLNNAEASFALLTNDDARNEMERIKNEHNYSEAKKQNDASRELFEETYKDAHGYKEVLDSVEEMRARAEEVSPPLTEGELDTILETTRMLKETDWNHKHLNDMLDAWEEAPENQSFKNLEQEIYKEWEQTEIKRKGYTPTVMSLYVKLENPLIYDFGKEGRDDLNFAGRMAQAVGEGRDGCIFYNVKDGADYDTIYTVFDNKQFKSADPFVYDNKGKLIPLEKRFDSTAPDIRYSLIDNGNPSLYDNLIQNEGISEWQANVSPYLDTYLTDDNHDELVSRVKGSYDRASQEIATALGIGDVSRTETVGGYINDEGKKLRELSFANTLNTTYEKAKMYACLMGDLAYENQEAVIVARTVPINSKLANALKFTFGFKDQATLEQTLRELGIYEYTLNAENKTLDILDFDFDEDNSTVFKLLNAMGDNYDGLETRAVQSDYITREGRKSLYETWLNSELEGGRQNDSSLSGAEQYVRKALEQLSKVTTENASNEGAFLNEPTTEAETDVVPYTQNVVQEGSNTPSYEEGNIEQSYPVGESRAEGNNAVGQNIEAEYQRNLNRYGAFEPGMEPRQDIKVPRATDYGPTSQFARNYAEAPNLTNEESIVDFAEAVNRGEFAYDSITNQAYINEANSRLDREGVDKMLDDVMKNTNISARLIAEESVLMRKLAKNNDPRINDLAVKMAGDATLAGQTLQAFQILKRLTPEGQLASIRQNMNRMQAELDNKYGAKSPTLTIDPQLEYNLMNAKTDAERQKARDDIMNSLFDQTPVTLADKIRAWRYLAMLGNPTTHIRNILGNLMFAPLVSTKNAIGAVLERAIIKDGIRTKAIMNPLSQEYKDFYEAGEIAYEDYKGAIEKEHKYETQSFGDGFIAKGLNKVSDFNSWALDKEDFIFSKARFADSYAQFLKANNLTPDTIDEKMKAKAVDYAMLEAQKATYRDFNSVADWLNKTERSKYKGLRMASFFKDAIIPFTKTPFNIVKRGVEYSPVGLAKSIIDGFSALKQGKITANQWIDEMSAGLTGSGIFALGYLLRSLGIFRTKDDDKDRKQNFDKTYGEQDYSINVGDGSYTIDWLAPSVMPLAMGAEWFNLLESVGGLSGLTDMKGKDAYDLANGIVDATAKVMDPIAETSMLSSLKQAMQSYSQNSAQYLSNVVLSAGASYISQFFPTLGGKVARAFDETARTTYPNKGTLDKTVRQIKNKIPGLSQSNEPSLDTSGQAKKNTGGNFFGRLAFNLLSPGYYASTAKDEYAKEAYRLYESTGELDAFPSNFGKDFTYEKTAYKFNDKQYTEYNQVRLQLEDELIKEFMDSAGYDSYSDSEKVEQFKEIRKYAGQVAKEQILKGYGIDYEDPWYDKAKDAIEDADISANDYFSYTSRDSKKQKDTVKYLESTDLTNKQKEYLYDLNGWKTSYQDAYKKVMKEGK